MPPRADGEADIPSRASLKKRFAKWIPSREEIEANPALRLLGPRLAHPRLWHWSRRGVAIGLGVGMFIGVLFPIAQIAFSAFAMLLLRANLPAAAAATFVSNPLTTPGILYLAYLTGCMITGDQSTLPDFASLLGDAQPQDKTFWQSLSDMGKPLLIGLAILSVSAGLLTYLAVDFAWRLVTVRKWKARATDRLRR